MANFIDGLKEKLAQSKLATIGGADKLIENLPNVDEMYASIADNPYITAEEKKAAADRIALLKKEALESEGSLSKAISSRKTTSIINAVSDVVNKANETSAELMNLKISAEQRLKEAKDDTKEALAEARGALDDVQDMAAADSAETVTADASPAASATGDGPNTGNGSKAENPSAALAANATGSHPSSNSRGNGNQGVATGGSDDDSGFYDQILNDLHTVAGGAKVDALPTNFTSTNN